MADVPRRVGSIRAGKARSIPGEAPVDPHERQHELIQQVLVPLPVWCPLRAPFVPRVCRPDAAVKPLYALLPIPLPCTAQTYAIAEEHHVEQ